MISIPIMKYVDAKNIDKENIALSHAINGIIYTPKYTSSGSFCGFAAVETNVS